MDDSFEFESYIVERIVLEREINFVITEREEYIGRLVPHECGLQLSPLDLALNNQVGGNLVEKIGDFIVRYYE